MDSSRTFIFYPIESKQKFFIRTDNTMSHEATDYLDRAGIKPTPNRILVLDALLNASCPLSLVDLETELGTLEKSSVFRVLNVLLEKDLVHTLEDGRGITKYEVCHGHDHHSARDMHPHFYCERCHNVYCLDTLPTPDITLPSGFQVKSVNFMFKGICPSCSHHL